MYLVQPALSLGKKAPLHLQTLILTLLQGRHARCKLQGCAVDFTGAPCFRLGCSFACIHYA